MARFTPRPPQARRLRLQRALARYRRSHRAHLTLLLGSVATILVSVAVVVIASHSAGDDAAIQPLFKVDGAVADAEPSDQAAPTPWAARLATVGDADAAAATAATTTSRRGAADAAAVEADAEVRGGPVEGPLPTGMKRFNERPVRAVAQRRMLVTAYCPCARCCGKHADGITAAGYSVFANGGKLVAADTRILPFGTLLSVPGYAGEAVVPVLDTGKDIKGDRLDLLFASHRAAKAWGRRWVTVTIYDHVD